METKSSKQQRNEYELKPLLSFSRKDSSRSTARIVRCPTTIAEFVADNLKSDAAKTASSSLPVPGGPSTSQSKSGQQSDPQSDEVRKWKLDESHPRFGHLYHIDQPSIQKLKNDAWDHLVKKSSIDSDEVMEMYSTAIRRAEEEAKRVYAEKPPGTGSEVRKMWIRDGCFFLQLMLLVLGWDEELGYGSDHLIFGRNQSKRGHKIWVEAMFFVGNQVPLVILKELMSQKFFKDIVLSKSKWTPNPSSLCENALYKLLVLPVLMGNSPSRWVVLWSSLGRNRVVDQKSSDILHGLQTLLLGSPSQNQPSGAYELDEDFDLEANQDSLEDDYMPDPNDEIEMTNKGERLKRFLKSIGFSSMLEDRKRIFPCATDLKRAGITIKKLGDNQGIRSIHFQSRYFWANLYLPTFPVDENLEKILQNLKIYESQRHLAGHQQEVSSYLRFMSDIVRNVRDAKLLSDNKIIVGDARDVEKLPGILNRLASDNTRLTHQLHTVRRQIRDYSSPWIHYKGVINVVVFLTLLQALFAVLAYFRPPKA